jgi:cation-transporting ATPase 13A3/4/5
MGVICHNEIDNKFRVFVKGAPEKLIALCHHDSIPSDFEEVLHSYAKDGLRIIAFATKILNVKTKEEASHIEREEAEKDLTFLGLMIAQNKVKPDSRQVIHQLN